MTAEIDSTTGLRQVNAGTGTLAAYRSTDALSRSTPSSNASSRS